MRRARAKQFGSFKVGELLRPTAPDNKAIGRKIDSRSIRFYRYADGSLPNSSSSIAALVEPTRFYLPLTPVAIVIARLEGVTV